MTCRGRGRGRGGCGCRGGMHDQLPGPVVGHLQWVEQRCKGLGTREDRRRQLRALVSRGGEACTETCMHACPARPFHCPARAPLRLAPCGAGAVADLLGQTAGAPLWTPPPACTQAGAAAAAGYPLRCRCCHCCRCCCHYCQQLRQLQQRWFLPRYPSATSRPAGARWRGRQGLWVGKCSPGCRQAHWGGLQRHTVLVCEGWRRVHLLCSKRLAHHESE